MITGDRARLYSVLLYIDKKHVVPANQNARYNGLHWRNVING